ncbi:MAG: pseudouridine synthase, partial [Longimicrobiales bacterium]
MRLQRFLSRAEVASRRRAESMILAGRVRVNGRVVTELGTRVDPTIDRVQVDDREVRIGAPVWIALHKPRGYVTTRDDPRGRRTVYDLLPPEYHGLFHVGRLDSGSEGLLLLTNQGDAANRLLHPRHRVARVYDAIVRGTPDAATLERLRRGVALEDGIARAERVELRGATRRGDARVRLLLREGRNREVRRMLAAIGHPVARLIRRRYGAIALGSLTAGEWRALSE